jgi:hypothetical protein
MITIAVLLEISIDGTTFILILIGIVVTLFIGKVLTGWYHELEKRNRYMEAQIQLLTLIARKLQADEKEVNEIFARTFKRDYEVPAAPADTTTTTSG